MYVRVQYIQYGYVPGVPTQCSMVQGVEAVVVGDGDVGSGLQQHRQHVVPLLTDGVVQRCVALRILQGAPESASARQPAGHTMQDNEAIPLHQKKVHFYLQ